MRRVSYSEVRPQYFTATDRRPNACFVSGKINLCAITPVSHAARFGHLIVGLIGAFIGDWLLPQLGVQFGTGIVS
jgi:hypothetical protein